MPIDSKSHILIVDDSGAIRSIVRKLLTQIGYSNIDEATDGAAALAKMAEKSYSLVISDWNMEPMNGKALLDHAQTNRALAKIPFIMMTVQADQYKIIAARYPGVVRFIDKPFSAEALQEKISQL